MVRREIEALVQQAARRAMEDGALPRVALPDSTVERPQRPEHGDYASNIALRLARAAGTTPLSLAEAIAARVPASDIVAQVEVAPPGFINFRLSPTWLAGQVEEVLRKGESFPRLDLGQGQRVQVEYVSANPTGPLTVAAGRGLAIGDTLANVLEAAGYRVEREYYINDAGTQTDTFAATLFARYRQLHGEAVEVPPGAYTGEYVVDLAREAKDRFGDRLLGYRDSPCPPELHRFGMERMLERIREDLALMGARYDSWFSEQSLYPEPYETVMRLLRERGYVTEKEGAVWFTSSALGEDKDNVLVRSNGRPTYFASDIAYHYHKFFVRGYDRVVDIWGADHQGHVPRMKAAVAALGIDPERLVIIIHQLVTLKRGGEEVRVSKRAGEIITLREVVEEVGADACRFFFLSRAPNSHMDFDLELAARQSAENPVYYVQYAHARMAGILLHARERALDYSDGDVSLLGEEPELALIRQVLRLPEMVETVARKLEPHLLPYYALDLATAFHDFYERCRVVSEDVPLSKARLKLVGATKAALAATLHLMGMSAPDRM
ncbi:MAG: arginine--tRNA ligase [Dehalococcoidia bacterium]|nr:arginine--tRNA ligase [Dehalococcoidia bacterium]MDW8009424.1 arginine--tRNA ligase [Chloroflexota bacterium]